MATIFDNLLAGIAVCDSQGRFIQANPACEAIFGYSQQDILGKTLADFIFEREGSQQPSFLSGKHLLHETQVLKRTPNDSPLCCPATRLLDFCCIGTK